MSGLCPNPWDFWDVFGLVFFFFNVILLWDIYRNKVKNERKIFEIAVLLFFSPKDVYTAHQAKFLLVHLIFDWASKNRRIFLGTFTFAVYLIYWIFPLWIFSFTKIKEKEIWNLFLIFFYPVFLYILVISSFSLPASWVKSYAEKLKR